jgi:hypothetical protein
MVMWAAAGVPHFSHLLREVGNLRKTLSFRPEPERMRRRSGEPALSLSKETCFFLPPAVRDAHVGTAALGCPAARCLCGDSRPRLSGGPEVSGRSPPVARTRPGPRGFGMTYVA